MFGIHVVNHRLLGYTRVHISRPITIPNAVIRLLAIVFEKETIPEYSNRNKGTLIELSIMALARASPSMVHYGRLYSSMIDFVSIRNEILIQY